MYSERVKVKPSATLVLIVTLTVGSPSVGSPAPVEARQNDASASALIPLAHPEGTSTRTTTAGGLSGGGVKNDGKSSPAEPVEQRRAIVRLKSVSLWEQLSSLWRTGQLVDVLERGKDVVEASGALVVSSDFQSNSELISVASEELRLNLQTSRRSRPSN